MGVSLSVVEKTELLCVCVSLSVVERTELLCGCLTVCG